MKKLVDIDGDDLKYVKRTAKEERLSQKAVIELCVTYARKRVLKIETHIGDKNHDLSEMQEITTRTSPT